MLRSILICLLFINSLTILQSQKTVPIETEDLTQYVNPFIGTGGHGHTFPGATVPFGMVQLSPDTRLEGWDGCSGYHYSDSVIYGFSHTHLSGTGVADYGDILLMPTSGDIMMDNGYKRDIDKGYASRFNKSQEMAEAAYYTVKLEDYNIDVELTCSERSAMHRYTYSDGKSANLILDLEHRDKLLDGNIFLDRLEQNEISGYRYSQAWAQNQKIFFVLRLSQGVTVAELKSESLDNKKIKAGFSVDLKKNNTLLIKIGISSVSIENARKNLNQEIPDWDFEKIKRAGRDKWQKELEKIKVEGGTFDQKTIFYTALYHTMIAPNLWSDVNGEYRGMDDRVYQLPDGQNAYSVFSLWDTFRATHPLFTIIQQDRTQDFIRTFLRQYAEGGRLPVWELAANETNCMIGYHSVSVATDAYVKGLRDWDTGLMLEAMKQSAESNHLGLSSYKRHACILAADESESVSKTLEYAYDDWCIAQYAKHMGEMDTYQEYIQRAQYYKNLYDPSTGFFRARMDGSWFGPFDPSEVNFNYTEANAWQYSLFVPQDISGLIELIGGRESFEKHLDLLFTVDSETSGRDQADITGLIGQYAHGNEPSHHMAYLYNYIGKPWKTADKVSQIINELYSNNPEGLSGNEDCGQMSAWYVLSSMGLYQVTPGNPEYAIGTPLFDKISIKLENGNNFIIESHGLENGHYINNADLDGYPLNTSSIAHDHIMQGGHLSLEMSNIPNRIWANKKEDRPQQAIDEYPITATPYFITSGNTFSDSITIKIGSIDKNSVLKYILDGNQEQEYLAPFVLKNSAKIDIWAESIDGSTSPALQQEFFKIDDKRDLKLLCTYANQYAAGGDDALIDYQRGNGNYRTGRWQGYEEQDFEAIVDLGSVQSPAKASIGFLQDIKSWIFYPPEVIFSVSIDGINYSDLDKQENSFSDKIEGSYFRDFEVELKKPLRYLKIRAPNYGPCPDWHLGAGGATWLFADEIVIE
jgi:predicted alpha-1,2-mannosidase